MKIEISQNNINLLNILKEQFNKMAISSNDKELIKIFGNLNYDNLITILNFGFSEAIFFDSMNLQFNLKPYSFVNTTNLKKNFSRIINNNI